MMPSSLLPAQPMQRSAIVCGFVLVAQVIITIFTSSVFFLPLDANQSAFGTLGGPNEQIVFFSDRDGNQQIYVMNAGDGSNQTRLTNTNACDCNPSWSPDGTMIAFNTDRDSIEDDFENQEIYVMNAGDGSNQTRLTNSPT